MPLSAPIAALRPLLLIGGLLLLIASPAQAQSQRYLLGPGSAVGPETKIKPTNCVTAPDGTITCDTKIENPPSDTPAKPQFDPFDN
jgi:hypothetical protein